MLDHRVLVRSTRRRQSCPNKIKNGRKIGRLLRDALQGGIRNGRVGIAREVTTEGSVRAVLRYRCQREAVRLLEYFSVRTQNFWWASRLS